jgi:single-strand DNA-binding protein
MAGSLNRVELIGRLGADPEIRATTNGAKVVNFRIATGEAWTDKETGERKENTEWHQVVIFNEKIAETAERYLRKGSKAFIAGQLKTRKWQDKDGSDRYSTEIVLGPFRSELLLLDGKDKRAATDPGDYGTTAPAPARPAQTGASTPPDIDDEIPF